MAARKTAVHCAGTSVSRCTKRRAKPDADRHLAFVGRANVEKGPEVAVRVAKLLGRHLKMAVKINEPAEQDHWDEHVAPLLVGADVEVVRNGTKQDAIDIMSGAEATLFPISWPEPFDLVMVESMAVGTPVIAYAAGASLEVIDSGRTGVLVPPDDLDAFVAAVRSAGSFDRAVCRSHVVEHFSSAAMVGGYEAVFATVTEQQLRPRTSDRASKLRQHRRLEWDRRQDLRRPVTGGALHHPGDLLDVGQA